MQKEVEADFKRLYGKDLTVENLEYAYHNTTIIGKGYLGEGDQVARPVFKFNGEFEKRNMHLLAFTLCQAVECKGMGRRLRSLWNRKDGRCPDQSGIRGWQPPYCPSHPPAKGRRRP